MKYWKLDVNLKSHIKTLALKLWQMTSVAILCMYVLLYKSSGIKARASKTPANIVPSLTPL